MKILLHVCCGPCATYPFAALAGEGHEVDGYFFNPNIHPYREYLLREEAAREFARRAGRKIIIPAGYDPSGFFRSIANREEERCRWCYLHRLSAAAAAARAGGYQAFTTTLLLSPHQKRRWVIEAGDLAAREKGVDFLDRDFRGGWREHWSAVEKMGLYKQQYCGCLFSEYERFRSAPASAASAGK